jgi:hypothetical protein
LCPDFSESRTSRKVKKLKKKELTPALIDGLRVGKLDNSKTGALSIEVLPSGKRGGFTGGGSPAAKKVLDIREVSVSCKPGFSKSSLQMGARRERYPLLPLEGTR